MDLHLKDKVVWIVGGSTGIGYACAKSLLLEGAKVAISSRDEHKLSLAARQLYEETETCPLVISADANDPVGMEETFRNIIENFGGLNILIYSAGISKHGKLMELEPEDWKKNWELNIVSFFRTVKLIVPELKKAGGGSIAVLGASSGKQPTPNQLISNTTKGSLLPMVKTLAEELAPDNILINNICPGRFLTTRRYDIAKMEEEKRGVSFEDYINEVAETVPLKRLGDPEEIADFISFIVSPKGSYITGQSISVDGGLIRSII
ncbi:SDR family NAD(P)-dependent oxidoreductase [Peribacillus saganii]|nr:SDR family oxidoreductase [Peribacillus saganii]